MTMRMLVTGGAGFIGCNFIDYMIKRYSDIEITCLDLLTYAGDMENLDRVAGNERFAFVKGDIADDEGVDGLFKDKSFDIVVNFAAESHVDRSIEDPGIFIRTNVRGSQVLMDACRKYGVKRFHQVSTDEVYGDLALDRPDLKFTEESCLRPSSPYSASKASADLLVLSYFRTFGLDATISRCSNNYGPYQNREKLIPLMITMALQGKRLPVYGKGINIRDWIHVLDHCRGIDAIIRNGRAGTVYNVGGSCEKSNIEVVRTILSELVKDEDLIEFVKDRPGHDLRYAIDSSRIEKDLGWRAQVMFEDGIRETIKWYVERNSD